MADTQVSYEEFLKQAKASGLIRSFSEADLALAQARPDIGLSLLSYKQDYVNAPSDVARALANAGAEKLRREYGGYLGGGNGAGYTPVGTDADAQSESYANQIGAETRSSAPDFYADAARLWADDRKQYLREGERAYQNALGAAAANTGGIASTAAITAAQQAQNYYGAQAADRKSALYQQAYENWLAGQQNDRENRLTDSQLRASAATQTAESDSAASKAFQQSFDNAMTKWKAYGYVTEDIADILALPVGTAYTDQAEREWEQAYKELSSGVSTNKTQYDAVNLGEREIPGDSAAAHKTVSMGANSLDVQTMQRYLIALGYSCGASGADGKFGAGTQRALINFQSAAGIYPDGVCGPVTWTALIEQVGA